MLDEGIKLFGVIDFRFEDLVDIIFVSVVLYYVFLLFRRTRAVQMLAGFAFIGVLYFLAIWWELKGVEWLLSNMATIGVVSLVILFQPEIRSALMRIGQTASRMSVERLFFHDDKNMEAIEVLVNTSFELSRSNYGALIVIEKNVGLKNHVDTGEFIDSIISAKLLRSLFFPNSPLHDGAVIISKNRIIAAGCVLPVTAFADDHTRNLGMRHRAARTLANESDALVIVVSEETKKVSLAFRNKLHIGLTEEELREKLKKYLTIEQF